MAKKKATSASKNATAKSPAPKVTAPVKATSVTTEKDRSSSNGAPAKGDNAFDDETIGLTAGAVWLELSKSGSTTLTALKKEIDSPGDLVIAAVGWLAREEKLSFATAGRSVKISLK